MLTALCVLNVVQSAIIGVLLLRRARLFEEPVTASDSVTVTLSSDVEGLV